ncbi:hypothetical protein VPH35_067077 [Triticum aestivum]
MRARTSTIASPSRRCHALRLRHRLVRRRPRLRVRRRSRPAAPCLRRCSLCVRQAPDLDRPVEAPAVHHEPPIPARTGGRLLVHGDALHGSGVSGQNAQADVLCPVAPPDAEGPVGRAADDDVAGHRQAHHRHLVALEHAAVSRLAVDPVPVGDQPVRRAHVDDAVLGRHGDGGDRALALPEHLLQDMLRRVALRGRLPPPHLDGAVGGPGEHDAVEPGGGHGVHCVVVRADGLEALGVRHAPHLEGPVPRGRVEQPGALVEAEGGHGVRVPKPHRALAPLALRLDVAGGVDRALEVVLELGERPHLAVHGGVVRVGAPHAHLAVLVTGEDAAVVGDDDGLDEAAGGPEPGELALVPPHAHVPGVGSGVKNVPGRRQRVDVAVLLDQRRDEARGPRFRDGAPGAEAREVRPRRPGRGRGGGAAVARRRGVPVRGGVGRAAVPVIVRHRGGGGGEGPRRACGHRGRLRPEEVEELLVVTHGSMPQQLTRETMDQLVDLRCAERLGPF